MQICDLISRYFHLFLFLLEIFFYFFIIQALISGEDKTSIFLFLDWTKRHITHTPSIVLIDDSSSEFAALQNVYPTSIILRCMWHLEETIKKHLDLNSSSLAKAESIRQRFSGKEELQIFEFISTSAISALYSTSIDEFEEKTSSVSTQLNCLINWWNEKEDLTQVKLWWNGFLNRKEDWGLCFRMNNYPQFKSLILQEKSTGRSESYHGTLKTEKKMKKYLRTCDYLQSVKAIISSAGRN
jgi:hypothetical protein